MSFREGHNCNNVECRFHPKPPIWIGKPLPLKRVTRMGGETLKRPIYLCPICYQQMREQERKAK